jgi:ABC-type glycerol-3-phosphate transport system permease component
MLVLLLALWPVAWLLWTVARSPGEVDALAVALRDWQDEAGASMLAAQLRRSAGLSLGLPALAMLLGVPAGFALATERFPGRRFVLFLCLVAVAVPAPLWLSFHLFARTLVDSSDPVAAVVMVTFGLSLPCVVLLTTAAMETLPDQQLAVGRLEGQSLGGLLWNVGLPARRADLVAVFCVLAGLSWGATLTQTVLLTSAGEMSLLSGQALLSRLGQHDAPLAAFTAWAALPGVAAQLVGVRRTAALAMRALVRLRSEF